MAHVSVRGRRLSAIALILVSTLLSVPAGAQSREETLRYVTGGSVNTLDPVMLGATPEATALSSATYDRLVAFDSRPAGDYRVFDFESLRGELAESFEVSEDGLTLTFHLRPDALWQDGRPVTAEDVKWSLDRAVSAETMSKAQLATGSLTDPSQFTVVDERTVRITLEKADRLALPNLASLYAPIYNSELAREHATDEDPWALEWLKDNTAGSGAYAVSTFRAGQQVVLDVNEGWANGPRPSFRRVIVQTVPEASTRANLVERGDADITLNLQSQDLRALEGRDTVKVASIPMPTAAAGLIFNTRMEPFDNVLVRQAVALALPYDNLFETAVLGRGEKLYGAGWQGEPEEGVFPQALPWSTDLDLARQKLAEAGYPEGFETTLSFGVNRANFAEPAAALIQESLARIGITVRIDKLPDPQMAEAITDKRLPMLIERTLALFPSTEYYFRIFFSGPSRWNYSSWDDARVNEILPRARFEADQAAYEEDARRLVGLLAEEVPMTYFWKQTLDVVMAPSIEGFTAWYHYNVDFRDLSRT
ncbi:ABC transporter substrate-binding protein [Aureimonas populi]|uniref:ABC transporter substrate-binding protein n=1 Tax=Aureimonas populi TaxID=1701758 RepID=A0ABW5CQF5_9HYPH|nr:ABC transporter substrate-binding protein [Aureimonas populi]